MPISGGVFSRDTGVETGATAWNDTDTGGRGIISTDHDTHDQDIADAINTCVFKDGTSTITQNIPFNNKKITGLADGTAATDAANLKIIQNGGVIWGGTSGGSANTQTISLTPALAAYIAGQRFIFIPGFRNTAAATININGLGAKTIKRADGSDLLSGDLFRVSEIIYDGTNFRLLNSIDDKILYRAQNDFVLTNTTTITNIFAYTLPANTLKIDRILKVRAGGRVYNQTGSSELYTIAFYWGGNLFLSITATCLTVVTNGVCWEADVIISPANNLGNSQRAQGKLWIGGAGSGVGSGGEILANPDAKCLFDLDFFTKDTTLNQEIKVTGQLNAASANYTMECNYGFVELV